MSRLTSGTSAIAALVLWIELLITGCAQDSSASSFPVGDLENPAPTIAGNPATQVVVGYRYDFRPSASDPLGRSLAFSATGIPRWATFNKTTGRLTGIPATTDVGMYSNIRIAVSNGLSSTTLPEFGILVADAADNRKSNPGHYIALNRNDTDADLLEAAQQIGVRGIQKRYYWNQLEPSFENYNFSAIQADLELVASQGKMLVVFVEDKTFNGELPTPPYLHSLTAGNRNGGFTAIRWDPYVVLRFSRLLEALAQSTDAHPALEGIAIQESSLGFEDSTLALFGYSPEKYRDALVQVLTLAAQQFSSSRIFWYMNYLPQGQDYLEQVATSVAAHGVAIGGPDVLPDSEPLVRLTYPLYDQLYGQATMFNSIQYDSYGHPHADASASTLYWTMTELFEFARDELHVKYLFWTRKSFRNPADSFMWFDALPVIQEYPVFNE